MTPGFTGAEIENLVNTAITEAVHNKKEEADKDDFEFARDRILMGIERKKPTMNERDRLHVAIHESGHALVGYFNPNAMKLYKATCVSRGGSAGVVSTIYIADFAAIFEQMQASFFISIMSRINSFIPTISLFINFLVFRHITSPTIPKQARQKRRSLLRSTVPWVVTWPRN